MASKSKAFYLVDLEIEKNMKSIIALIVAVSVSLFISTVNAAPNLSNSKFSVAVYSYDRGTNGGIGVEISIGAGQVEYVADAAAPNTLKWVRVWKGPDSLLYDLYSTGAEYGQSYGNEPKDDKKMTQAQAAKAWAGYVKKFEDLRKTVEVTVRK